jgi:hypothetical protein
MKPPMVKIAFTRSSPPILNPFSIISPATFIQIFILSSAITGFFSISGQ